jgi:hypothetical protein
VIHTLRTCLCSEAPAPKHPDMFGSFPSAAAGERCAKITISHLITQASCSQATKTFQFAHGACPGRWSQVNRYRITRYPLSTASVESERGWSLSGERGHFKRVGDNEIMSKMNDVRCEGETCMHVQRGPGRTTRKIRRSCCHTRCTDIETRDPDL